jgi:hypothetical protein
VQLVELAASAAEHYTACTAELQGLVDAEYPEAAVPHQLRAQEEQLRQRLEVSWLVGGGRVNSVAVVQ